MPVFYPALAVNLTLRFDEALLSGSAYKPESAEDLASSVAGLITAPKAVKDNLTHILSIIPKQASLELPGYRSAGKFSLTFAWRDLPLDPRALRAIRVEIFVGTVTPTNFQRGMNGELDNGRAASYLVQDSSNLMLVGTVDNHTVTFNDKASEVKLDGRDLRGIYLDGKIAPETLKQLKVDQPVNLLVKDVLGYAPMGANIEVHVDPEDWTGGIVPSPHAQELVDRITKGAKGDKVTASAKGSSASLSFWDVITQFTLLVGAVPYFRGNELWLRPARSLYDQKRVGKKEGANNKTPFKNAAPRSIKTADSSIDIQYRRMIYGRNIASLNYERKLGGTKVPSVVCVGIDPSKPGKDSLLEVEWPAVTPGTTQEQVDAAQVTNVDADGSSSATDKMRVPVPGIVSKERLREIARQIYEEVGRGEMGGSCSSKDLASLGGDNEDADMLHLRPGDAVEFLVDATGINGLPPVVSQLNSNAEASAEEAVQALSARLGGRTELAKVLVGTARGKYEALQSTFRVANVKYTWAVESGLGVDFDFQNYIESRYDVEPSVFTEEGRDNFTEGLAKSVQKRTGIEQAEAKAPSRISKKSTEKAPALPWDKGVK